MPDGPLRTCIECRGAMVPIVVIDKSPAGGAPVLEYRQADDRRSFWSGRYPTAGPVESLMCGECGRIALYGRAIDASS